MKRVSYRELVGSLLSGEHYKTRSGVCSICWAVSTRIQEEFIAKHALRYLISTTNFGITYSKSGKPLHAYVDADWGGNIDNRRSCIGHVLVLAEGPISWKSKQQKSIALSIMEAEYMAFLEVVKKIIYTPSYTYGWRCLCGWLNA